MTVAELIEPRFAVNYAKESIIYKNNEFTIVIYDLGGDYLLIDATRPKIGICFLEDYEILDQIKALALLSADAYNIGEIIRELDSSGVDLDLSADDIEQYGLDD
jgi:hypothetical protein